MGSPWPFVNVSPNSKSWEESLAQEQIPSASALAPSLHPAGNRLALVPEAFAEPAPCPHRRFLWPKTLQGVSAASSRVPEPRSSSGLVLHAFGKSWNQVF